MNVKLTLYGEKSIADEIKAYAKMNNTSVSKMVFEFFERTLNKEQPKHTASLMELSGILKGHYPDDVDFKEVYHKALEEKYL